MVAHAAALGLGRAGELLQAIQQAWWLADLNFFSSRCLLASDQSPSTQRGHAENKEVRESYAKLQGTMPCPIVYDTLQPWLEQSCRWAKARAGLEDFPPASSTCR